MALPDSDTSVQSGLDAVAPEAAAVPYGKAPAARGPYALPTAQGAIGVDPELLANMQKLIDEKQAQKGSFMENMKDAQAWWSGGVAGPSEGLRNREIDKSRQEQELFGMRSQLSQAKIGMAQTKALQESLFGSPTNASTTNTLPPSHITAGAPTSGSSMVQQGGMLGLVEDPALRQSIGNQALRDPVGAQKAIQEYLAKNANKTDMIKDVQYMVQHGLVDPKLIPAAVLTKFVGPGAFVPHDVRGTAGTGQATPFGTATGVAGGAPVGAPMAPTAAPAAAQIPMPLAAPAAPVAGPQAIPAIRPPAPPQITRPPAPVAPVAPIAPVPQAPAPVAPAPAAPQRVVSPFAPGTKEDLEFKSKSAEVPIAGATSQATESGKLYAAGENTLRTQGMSAGTRQVTQDATMRLLDDPEVKNMVGKYQTGSKADAFVRQMQAGIEAGNFGSIGLKELQENLAKSGASPEAIRKFAQLESFMKQNELEWSTNYLKGQGAVSDNERGLVQKAVGSVNDPIGKLKTLTATLRERALFDAEVYNAYKKNKGMNFGDFLDSDQFQALNDKHNNRLANILSMNPADLKSNEGFKIQAGVATPSASGSSWDAAKEKRYQDFKASQTKAK